MTGRRQRASAGDDSGLFRFATGDLPERDRLAIFREQFGREVLAQPGDAMLGSNADTGTFTCSLTGGTSLLISLSRQDLRPLVRDFDGVLLRRVPAGEPALRLLMTYVGIFEQTPTLAPELERLAVGHVYDLVAMMLGATRDASNVAAGRGVRAARLRAIKADVVDHLGERDLSIHAVAKRQGISPVYIRKLFESEGTSFSEFALEQRLARAHRMLRDARFADLAISTMRWRPVSATCPISTAPFGDTMARLLRICAGSRERDEA